MRVLIRAESGPSVGIGHVMRCVTLAAELVRRGHHVAVAPGAIPEFVEHRLATNGVHAVEGEVHDPAELLDQWGPDVLVVDGYGLAEWVATSAARRVPCVVVDDNHELPVESADLVVNQNLHAHTVDYGPVSSDDPRLLLGPEYAMLRAEVIELVEFPRPGGAADVLVAMGGTDPARLTAPVVHRLAAMPGVRSIDVALDESHADRAHLDDAITASGGKVRFADADLTGSLRRVGSAVVGGGSTLWELAALGIPSVAAIVADNQVEGSRHAEAAGFTLAVDVRGSDPESGGGRLTDAFAEVLRDSARFGSMSVAGRDLFDGRGPGRIVDAIERLTLR